VDVDSGAVLLAQGEPGSTFLLLSEGSVAVRRTQLEADIAVLGPGEIVGELSVLRRTPRTASIVALSPVVAFEGDHDTLWALLQASPGLGASIGRLAAGRMAAFAPVTELQAGDGLRLHIRPILPSDRERAPEASAGFSARSRYLRFFTSQPLPDRVLRQFIDIDYVNDFAWVALIADAPSEPYVASARYVRQAEDTHTAELAFGVIDEHQGKGVGRLLLGALAVAAQENGIEHFHAVALWENSRIQALLTHAGAHWKADVPGVVVTDFEVPDPDLALPGPTVDALRQVVRTVTTALSP
jgi:CRP-like cAMP-binding protein